MHLYIGRTHTYTGTEREKGSEWEGEKDRENKHEVRALHQSPPSVACFPRMFPNNTTYWTASVQILALSGTFQVHTRTIVRA